MKRPAFKVTGGVVTAFVIMGALRVVLQPLLPPSEVDKPITLDENSMIPAPVLEVGWRKNLEEGVAEARRKKLSVLIFFVDPSNSDARNLELIAFREPELVRYIKRNYVPVRVNLDDFPEWDGYLFPIGRCQTLLLPGMNLTAMTPEGFLLGQFSTVGAGQFKGYQAIQQFLTDSKAVLDATDLSSNAVSIVSATQNGDIRRLTQSAAQPIPSFLEFGVRIRETYDRQAGGFNIAGIVRPMPLAFRYLASLETTTDTHALIRQTLKTSLVDVVDGGFYKGLRREDRTWVDTTKSSMQIALMAETLAELGQHYSDPELTAMALDCVETLLVDMSLERLPAGSRMSDQAPDSRSRRSSLLKSKLSDTLGSEEQEWVSTNLSPQEDSRQELPRFNNLATLTNPTFRTIRQKLRERLPSAPILTRNDRIDVIGYVGARLFRIAQLTGDNRALVNAQNYADICYSGITLNEVPRFFGQSIPTEGTLSSYLAVADIALADYLHSGRVIALNHGIQALSQALKKFKSPDGAFLVRSTSGPMRQMDLTEAMLDRMLQVPEVADPDRESTTAQAIRLSNMYAQLTPDPAQTKFFLQFASSSTVLFSPLLSPSGPDAAGYYNAALDVVRGVVVRTYGKDAIKLAESLSRQFPLLPVVPIVTASCPPAQRKFSGIYLGTGGGIRGPLSVTQLQEFVTQRLQVPGE